MLFQYLHNFRNLIGIHLVGFHFYLFALQNVCCQRIAFGFGAACNHDFGKHIVVLSHLVRNNGADAACSDNENF